MPRKFSGTPVAVTFSTRGAFMPAWMVEHVAASAGVDGVDVDATSAISAWLAARAGTSEVAHVPVRAIWLPPEWRRSPRSVRLVESIVSHQPDDPPHVVLLLPTASSMREIVKTLDAIRRAVEPAEAIVGLPSSALKGGRPHLVQLGGMRRFAEEWDFQLAIDLSGRFDPTWEAEAAVARLGNRLRVIRVMASAPSRAAVGRDRVACRALHAALDRDANLDVAVSSVRPVPFPVTPRAAAQAAERAATYVFERAAIHARALREGIDRYEGSTSPRGN